MSAIKESSIKGGFYENLTVIRRVLQGLLNVRYYKVPLYRMTAIDRFYYIMSLALKLKNVPAISPIFYHNSNIGFLKTSQFFQISIWFTVWILHRWYCLQSGLPILLKLLNYTVFLHAFLILQFFLFPFLMQNGYRYHCKAQWLNFIYIQKFIRNYFAGRLKYAKLGKSTRLTFWVPVPKVVEVIP